MSQATLWGHASRVPGRGWRGWLRPLRSPGRPRSGRPWRARGRQVARIGGNLNHLGAVSGLVERRRRPHWDDLPSHLAGEKPRPAAGFVDTPRSQRRLMAFPLGIAGGERPPAEGGMGVHMPTLRDADRGIESGGSLSSTAESSGAASPLRRPWCNRKAANDMRRRRRAHRKGVLVSIHPRCLMGTRGSASAPGDGRCTVAAL